MRAVSALFGGSVAHQLDSNHQSPAPNLSHHGMALRPVLQTTQKISIKGVRDGLLITLGLGDFAELLDELTSELTLKKGFFRGSRVVLDVKNRRLERKQLLY